MTLNSTQHLRNIENGSLSPSSVITVSMQSSRPPGCLMETGRREGGGGRKKRRGSNSVRAILASLTQLSALH